MRSAHSNRRSAPHHTILTQGSPHENDYLRAKLRQHRPNRVIHDHPGLQSDP
jgi:hypothetical protein